MKRKKWTPNTNITDELLKFREKRKWQLALRRYVLENKVSALYAPYFGLDAKNFRKWIEIQFTEGLTWDNFGIIWQFDHIVPVAYFEFSSEQDLRLCWNFINIRVDALEQNKNRGNRIDVLAVKNYFQILYTKTHFDLCLKMLEKINTIEVTNIESFSAIEGFIVENKNYIETLSVLTSDEFVKLNQGISIKEILLEREIITKFAG